MASGTINLTQSGYLQGYIYWSSTSNGSTANTSTVTAKIYIRKDPTATTEPTWGTWWGSITIAGTATNWQTESGYSIGQSYVNVGTATKTVSHADDGTKSITISGVANAPSGTSMAGSQATGSGTAKLDTIPRYATVSQSVTSKTETTITVKWTSDSTISYVWYSTDGGSSYTRITTSANTKTGTYTISGLTAFTSYSVRTKLRRKDSGLDSPTTANSVKTYNYPYCTSAPSFTIGSTASLKFYNPLERSFTFYTAVNGTTIANAVTTAGTSYQAYGSSSSQEQLYATMPNDTSATYTVTCVYNSSNIAVQGGTVSVNPAVCRPTVGTVSYSDTNATTQAITGDSGKIIQNKSTVTFNAVGASANNSASVASVAVTVNGTSYPMALTQPVQLKRYAVSGITINSSQNTTAKITVTDSRGLSTSTAVPVTMLAWTEPTAIINMARESNFYSTTYITVDANYSSLDGANVVTITYELIKKGESTVYATDTLTNNVLSSFQADNTMNWWVKVYVADLLHTTTYRMSLSRGTPIIFFDVDKSAVGVNCFPTNNDTLEALDVYMNGFRVMGLVRVLESTDDLNTFITQGIYYQNDNAIADESLNYPVKSGGYLEVLRAGAIVIQKYTAYRTPNNSSKASAYIRSYYGGTWSSWEKALTNNDLITTTVSGTTSSNGNLSLGLDSTVTVINVVETAHGYECGYYLTTGGNYYATVRAYGAGTKMASTAVTVKVTYIVN